ncbi:flavin monoamine oxidase family protein [Tahibacter amnicola]|uniref:Tryptophan 2-monooxygenase n=1 Tax=Tahibacter amnicola TaxID=2976241 RepID=A0ABY6BHJ6_9GAMM|nr:FAD-dependent oxidoreductase [Tahibacter amnicola]UXI68803.1 FAD-dependent oxidoreductase [Tahibacter amnicola]
MNEEGKPVTRRQFLEMVGAAGGAAAVYETMVALNLLATPPAYAGAPDTSGSPGAGKSVLVLGAGVAGLTAAYRLRQAGYAVTVVEASDRIGGRNFTVSTAATDQRNVIHQTGRTDQTCRFSGDPSTQYFEAGCGRIPYHHVALLELCRELNVALEPYIMETRANRFQTDSAFDAKAVENRRVANDTRGYIAELLAKAINRQCLDQELTVSERASLLSLLSTFGDISDKSDPPYAYKGSTRSGYVKDAGVTSPGRMPPPLSLKELLTSEFWKHRFYQPEDYLWQATLFHPVGGMRKIIDALVAAVGRDHIQTRLPVTRIQNGRRKVTVWFADKSQREADYCFSTIPLPLLGPLMDKKSFQPAFVKAVGSVEFAKTCKVGWQAAERFWENLRTAQDANGPQIFGGISWINHPITQMWYPSSGYFSKGPAILTGAYNYDSPGNPVATTFGELSLEQRLEVGLQGGERLHPDFRQYVPVATGLSIAWQQVPYIGGGWAEWDRTNPSHKEAYRRLLRPDQRFTVGGDQVSYLPGWQEGAVLSAYHAVELIMGRTALRAEAEQEVLEAPHSGSVTGAY